jgi:beta-lactamase regulating signal transducer with metallopeptidase domain
MIAMWMLYTIVISATLAVAATALEFVARALGAPTRFVWVAALAGSLVLSARSITRTPRQGLESGASSVVASTTTVGKPTPPAVATASAASSRPSALSNMLRLARGKLAAVATLDTQRFDAWNGALVAACVLTAAIALGYLAAGAVRVRRVVRRLDERRLDGHDVLVSADIGPALFGITRPRIIVPAWVLELPAADRRVILSHEAQHAAANDPALLLVGSVGLALQAWNPVLWLIGARLRLSIETDCDRRVLHDERGDVRAYGRLLVTVYERVAPVFTSPIAFAERPSNLEVRIRRMTERAPRMASAAGIGAACIAIALISAAWITPAPIRSVGMARSLASSPVPCWTGFQSLALLQRQARERYPSEVANAWNNPPTVIGFVFDSDCRVQQQAVAPLPSGIDDADSIFQYVFPKAPPVAVIGHADGVEPRFEGDKKIQQLHISYGVEKKPVRRAESVCGFGSTSSSLCAVEADVFIRVVDTTRVLIALREAPGTDHEVEHVLLVQSQHAVPDLLTRVIRNAYVEYQGGEVYVSSPVPGELAVLFTTGSETAIADRHPDATRFMNLVGISHYSPGLVDFDDVPNIRRLASCDVVGHVCYESSRRSFTFP